MSSVQVVGTMKIQSVSRWTAPRPGSRVLWQILIASAGIAALTWSGFSLRVNLTTISFLYLLLVFALAYFFGFWQASLTSLVAAACLDYFFTQPYFHFTITDPQNWVALGVFQIAAVIISRLSAKELRSAREAAFHRSWMEQLYELSRNSLLMDLRQPPGPQLVVLIQRIFGARAVALFDSNLERQDRTGDWTVEERDLALNCYRRNAGKDEPATESSQRVLQAVSGPVGALVIRGNLSPLVVDALASLAAIAIDRHQSFEKEEKADAARRGEQLRAAVMDALAHELKTPLTTVQTASFGLLELGGLTDSQRDLAKLIDDESVRLNELCMRLLVTAKLEADQLGLKTSEVNVYDLIDEVLASRPVEPVRNRIEVAVDDPAMALCVDRELVAMILTQYIDNARKYSEPETPIQITARTSHCEIVISVHNFGSAIKLEDRELIFDRFYRAMDMKDSVPGTGIGLSVVRKAAEAHRGHVWVVSDEKTGTTFFLSLPIERGGNFEHGSY
jgi:two-component system, OmpR family, sensor histidine kinase KdpD